MSVPAAYPCGPTAIFQTVFCATAATIVSGAMAERTKFICLLHLLRCYLRCRSIPISGHWIWGGGWLAELGFHDFAGSTAVHMVGGVCRPDRCQPCWAPASASTTKDGKPRAIPGHNLTLGRSGRASSSGSAGSASTAASTVCMDTATMLIVSAGPCVLQPPTCAAAVALLYHHDLHLAALQASRTSP